MNIEAYYKRYRFDESFVEAELRRLVGEIPRSCICLSGSLVEGIGNARSDLDAYVVSDARDAPRASFGTAQITQIGEMCVDIEYVHHEKLEKLIDRMNNFPSQEMRDQRNSALALTPGELKLIHNISIAIAVEGHAFLKNLQGRIDPKIQSRLLFDYCAVLLDTVHQDIIGFIEANDTDSAKLSLRMYRQHLAGAFLAACGETNPAEKWRSVKMRNTGQRYSGNKLPGGHTIEEVVATWFDLDASIAADSPLQSLSRLSLLSNAILPWGLQRFADGKPYIREHIDVQHGTSPELIDSPQSDMPLPVIAYDCVVRRDETGVWVSRLGSAKRIYLNRLGLETVLQFSGQNTIRGALNRLHEVSDARQVELARSLFDFHKVLSSEKLVLAKGISLC